MFRSKRPSMWRSSSTIHEPEPVYMEDEEMMPVPKAPKKKKYLPGEKLLRKINKERKKNTLDMSAIHESISSIIDELAST